MHVLAHRRSQSAETAAAAWLQRVACVSRSSKRLIARLLNVSVKTLQSWEQARCEPTGPAKALLRIVENEPAVAVRALSSEAA